MCPSVTYANKFFFFSSKNYYILTFCTDECNNSLQDMFMLVPNEDDSPMRIEITYIKCV